MRIYQALLHLYPSSFRAEYGGEMSAMFARRRRDAAGVWARLALWLEVLADVPVNAARVHADILQQDLRYTVRALTRAPGFAVTATLVAALGVGATTATFSVADHVLLRPLPFSDADRLVTLWQDQSFRGISRMELSPANYRDWQALSTSFEAMATYRRYSANLVGQGEPQRLEGAGVSGGLFPMLGTQAALGRVLFQTDESDTAPQTIVLSHQLWQTQFGGTAGVLGRQVVLDEAPHVIVGVMPPGFHFPSRTIQFWTPLRLPPDVFEDRSDTFLYAIAKLKREVTLDQAKSHMRLVAAQVEQAYPRDNARTSANVFRLRDEVSQQSRLLLIALLGASACVLLLACSNLASLLLTRALNRRHELAVRAAIGAGRERLIRQMLTESLVLAVCGGVLGVLVAVAAAPLAARLVPHTLPLADVPGVDWRMLVFAAVVTLATGIGFGAVPALRICRGATAGTLREGARVGPGRRTERVRTLLVTAQVAASVVLLAGAGLMIRALWNVQAVDPGFRADLVLTLRTALPMPKYRQTARRDQFYRRVLDEVRALPGVSSAAYISFLPMVHRGGIWPVNIDATDQNPADQRLASLRYVTPGFFATAGIPLRLGRDVSLDDTRESPNVAIVSESFGRRYLAGGNPIGRRFQFAFQERTIVGVAGDIRVRGLERNSEPQVYLPHQQVPDGSIIFYVPKDLAVRSSVSAATLIPSIRAIVSRADPQLPISDVRLLADIVEAETASRAVQVRVLGAFAAIAFVLAAVGIHGLLAYTVSNRTREIGMRIALGARPSDILSMVLRHSVVLTATGALIGVVLAYAAGRTMEAVLAGVSPADVPTFAAAVALSLLTATLGSLLPAWRAVRVDPIAAIRPD